MRVRNRQRGFSLIEMLTVVAIIGTLSLVTVPAFINYQRSLQVKNSMRQFTSDLRSARQRAVTQTSFVRVTVLERTPLDSQRVYEVEESRNRGATYAPIPARDCPSLATTDGRCVRELDQITWFTDDKSFTFLPNGTVQMPAGVGSETITIDSANRFGKKSFDITVSLSGKVSAQ